MRNGILEKHELLVDGLGLRLFGIIAQQLVVVCVVCDRSVELWWWIGRIVNPAFKG